MRICKMLGANLDEYKNPPTKLYLFVAKMFANCSKLCDIRIWLIEIIKIGM